MEDQDTLIIRILLQGVHIIQVSLYLYSLKLQHVTALYVCLLLQTLRDNGVTGDIHVVISALANTYINYVATLEEYNVQRYEGASTIYGPHTLSAFIQEFNKLAVALAKVCVHTYMSVCTVVVTAVCHYIRICTVCGVLVGCSSQHWPITTQLS